MFNLNNYVDSLLELVVNEPDKSKRTQIIESWVKTLKKHHRDLEWKRIAKVLEGRIEQLQIKAQVTVANEKEQKSLSNFFEKKHIPAEFTIEENLLGGAKVVWDNLLIDNSISSQLDRLKKTLQ